MDEQHVKGLIDYAFEHRTLMCAIGVFLLLRFLNATPLGKLAFYRRMLPFLPEAFGVAAAFLGGMPNVVDQGPVLKIAAGLWCGYLAQRAHKILGQTILGDDALIDARPIGRIEPVSGSEEKR